jgi:VWFA-related protein
MATSARSRLSAPIRWALCTAVLLAAAGTLTLRAQEKPAADKPPAGQIGGLHFIDVSELTIVNVDVAVSDKSGPVSDLTRDDFEVYQDGKLQELTNFAVYGDQGALPPAPAAASPAAAPAPAPTVAPLAAAMPVLKQEPLFITFYIDNENVSPLNRNRVLGHVRDFVYSRVKPPDQAMLMAYQRSLKVLQPFTSDPEEILEALRKVKVYTGGRTITNSDRKDIEGQIKDEYEGNQDTDRLLGVIRQFAQEQGNNLKFTIGALKQTITMMSGLPGRKVLVYVSDGLPMVPGLELYTALEDQFSDTSLLGRSRDDDATLEFRGLVTAATAAGVTIYTIDCRGLTAELGNEAENRVARSSIAASMEVSNYQDSLVYMAQETGGRALINTNDPTDGLALISKELSTYYSLGYRLAPTGQDRFHRIQVKVKRDKRYRLSYRKSFIEKSLATKVGDRVVSGLTIDIDDNPLGITVSTGDPSPSSGGRWLLPLEVRVPIGKVAFVPDGDQLSGYVSVYFAARDNEGKESDLQHIDQQIKVPAKEYESAKSKNYVVASQLLLEPGTYRISVGLRDQLTNQAGFAVISRPVHPEKT